MTAQFGMCDGDHTVVEVWKQGRQGVELGGHYPSEMEIADLAAWALEEGIID